MPPRTVLICQGKACRKGRSALVLAAFQAEQLPQVTITATGCLGQCGNGPMVVVLPDQVWYDRVQPTDVRAIAQHHLCEDTFLPALMYAKFHPAQD
jgi:(2Fe-2S) ferredoxin